MDASTEVTRDRVGRGDRYGRYVYIFISIHICLASAWEGARELGVYFET